MPDRNITSVGMRWLSVGLVCLLVLYGTAPPATAQTEQAPKLKIVILEGEGAINNIRQRTAREPIVQVQDENNRPVAGAVVLFTLPERGASGVFANGATSVTVTTDAQGHAAALGLRPNSVSGQLQIRVSASYQGQTASATISQTNALGAAAAAGGVSGKLIAILVIAGGAGAAGAIAATRGGGKSGGTVTPPAPSPTTITAGTPTLGPPR